MKEPRRGHSRRCRSAECHSEHAGDEHAFKNPLSKWYRQRKRHKDDEAQLLDPDYEGSHENSQGIHSGKGSACSGSNSATEPSRPQHKQPRPRTVQEQQPLVEDLITRTKVRPVHDKQMVPVVPVVPAEPEAPTKPETCQPPQATGRSRPLCPAERARLAFPGCCDDKPPGPPDAAHEPQRPSGVQSLDSLLGQLCPGGKCRLSMKIKDPQDSVKAQPTSDDKGSCTVDDVAQRQCSASNFPSSFPASIEVLMTVNHSCGMHKTLSEKSLHHDTSAFSVVHTKPGHRQEIISIPKSRFIMVSVLLSFVILACFAVTIYSFSVPPDYAAHTGNHTSASPRSDNHTSASPLHTPANKSAASTRSTAANETTSSASASVAATRELRAPETIVQRLFDRRPTSRYLGHRHQIVIL